MRKEERLNEEHLNFLLRGPKKSGEPLPETCVSWLSKSAWDSVQAYADLEDGDPPCSTLPQDISVSWRRFKEWSEDLNPEDLALPSDWKNLSHFEKLLIVRCLRPDRITMALSRFGLALFARLFLSFFSVLLSLSSSCFFLSSSFSLASLTQLSHARTHARTCTHTVSHELGQFFVEDVSTDLGIAFQDSTPTVPIFFILSPGVDPVKVGILSLSFFAPCLSHSAEHGTVCLCCPFPLHHRAWRIWARRWE